MLNTSYEMILNKKIIVFSFNAPYYLDATDISKIVAYYALYAKTPSFFDVAASILFQELTPVGSSPVSIPGTGYDLNTAVSPDPDQILSLALDLPENPPIEGTPTPVSTPIPSFFIGDTIPLKTGKILDHNGNMVPDGTVVRFLFTSGGDSSTTQQVETTTIGGIARASYRLSNLGVLEIRATSDPATVSDVISLEIKEGQAAVITAFAPTLVLTPTPLPNESQATIENSNTISPKNDANVKITLWLLAILILAIGMVASYWLGSRILDIRWGIRWSMTTVIGGLLVYSIVISGISLNTGSTAVDQIFLVVLSCAGGCGLGGLGGWIWHRIDSMKSQPIPKNRSAKDGNDKADQ